MFKLSPNVRILLVRTDNIGDVILTLPALASLRRKYPKAFIAYLCRWYTAPLLQGNAGVNEVLKIDEGFPFGILAKIKELKFDISIHFYVEPQSVILAAMGGVQWRVGPFSKTWSYFLTEKIKQDRSKVEKHEAEYNLDLAKECGGDGLTFPPALFLSSIEKREGAQILARTCGGPGAQPVLIHPGSHGSVETWPMESFLQLAVKTADRGHQVVFTAGKDEGEVVSQVQKLGHKGVHAIPAGSLGLRQLMAIISNSRMMICNSTGPLHIASALSIPTISFFPRVPLVTSAKRWGPFANFKLNHILSPPRDSAPLSSITPDLALEWVINVLQSKQGVDEPGPEPTIG